MTHRVRLDPNGIGVADHICIWDGGSIDKPNGRKLMLDLLYPGFMSPEYNNSAVRRIREGDIFGWLQALVAPILLSKNQFS